MTSDDKKWLEEIRGRWAEAKKLFHGNTYSFTTKEVGFLLTQLDEARDQLVDYAKLYDDGVIQRDLLRAAHLILKGTHGETSPLCIDIRKALDGSTDPDTGTKGSLGEE